MKFITAPLKLLLILAVSAITLYAAGTLAVVLISIPDVILDFMGLGHIEGFNHTVLYYVIGLPIGIVTFIPYRLMYSEICDLTKTLFD